jgi:hypothetical protein
MSHDLCEMQTRAAAAGRLLAVAAICATALGGVAGCGASSSKPAYCSDRSNLKDSVNGLTGVNLKSDGPSALQSQFQKVESDAKALVSSAKNSFPDQTSAIKSSVSRLSSTVKQLSSSPSAQQIAAVAVDVSGVTSAFKSFASAATSNC